VELGENMLLTDLPEAIIVYILSFLRLAPIAHSLQCSTAMKSVGQDLTVWMNGIANSVAATFKCSADGWLKIALHHFKGDRKALFEDTRSRESRYRACDPPVPHLQSCRALLLGRLMKKLHEKLIAMDMNCGSDVPYHTYIGRGKQAREIRRALAAFCKFEEEEEIAVLPDEPVLEEEEVPCKKQKGK
jgi:hypothetical protein